MDFHIGVCGFSHMGMWISIESVGSSSKYVDFHIGCVDFHIGVCGFSHMGYLDFHICGFSHMWISSYIIVLISC